MSCHTLKTTIELDGWAECAAIIEVWYQPEEDDTNTAESVTVESGRFLYNGGWVDIAEKDLHNFEHVYWNNLEL